MARPIVSFERTFPDRTVHNLVVDHSRLTRTNYRAVLDRLYVYLYGDELSISPDPYLTPETALTTPFTGAYWCYYCQAPTFGWDHIPPLSVVWKHLCAGEDCAGVEFICVPACPSCNGHLGTSLLSTLEARTQYIAEWRGRKGLQSPT